MRIDVYHHIEPDASVTQRLDAILTLLQGVQHMDSAIQSALADLAQKVTDEKTVEDSAVVLLGGLSAKLADLAAKVADNPAIAAAISDLATGISANKDALAAAVSANTPAA